MAKRRTSIASISAEEAQKALTYLVHEGTVTAKAVKKALQRRKKLIREIRERMVTLGVEVGDSAVRTAAASLRRAEKVTRKPRRKALSAAAQAARRLQGRYMSAVRTLSKEAKKQVKAIRMKSGVRAAIAAAKKLAS